MYHQQVLLGVHCYLIILLILVAVIGDYLVQHTKLDVYRALFDNITHAVIGGLSWLVVCLVFRNRYSSQTLIEIAICTLIASFIDVDHFYAARSFHLKDAINLKDRPPLHSSLLPLLTSLLIFAIAYALEHKWMLRLSLIILTAFASHHTRDATRRGFWFHPLGSTPPIPYFAYITITVAIPYFVCLILYYVDTKRHVGLPTYLNI